MGKFNRGGAGFGGKWGGDKGRPSFGGGRGGDRDGGRGRRDWGGEKEMHKEICAECGKSCEVPFRPSNDKPVYCSECFSTKGGNSPERAPRRDSENRFGNKPAFGGSQGGNGEVLKVLKELNSKMDALTSAISNMSGSKNAGTKDEKKEAPKTETKTKEKVSKTIKKVKAPEKKVSKKKAK